MRRRDRSAAPRAAAPKPPLRREPLFAALDHAVVTVPHLARSLRLATGHGLFSADRLDDGTRLLLAHLPAALERAEADVDVLDLGCGYGALGLPIAATRPNARVLLVDRDLVAVAYAARNAETLGLTNARCEGGLGLRDLAADARFDVVLCNVPARLGDAAIAHLFESGAARLRPGGTLHAVVIRDLGPVVARVVPAAREVARGARHVVVALDEGPITTSAASTDVSPYVRDTITVEGTRLTRPHDLGEDASHLREALPVLCDVLPRDCTGRRALVVRGGYGAIGLTLAARGAEVIAADRDLLATAFTRLNASQLGLRIDTREVAWLPEAAREDERFELVVAEVSDTAGTAATLREITSVRKRLAPRGEALWLTRTKHVAPLVAALEPHGRAPRPLATRGAFTVLRDAP
jgi:16S rRNA (guanine1207-N2)-methyltransferase